MPRSRARPPTSRTTPTTRRARSRTRRRATSSTTGSSATTLSWGVLGVAITGFAVLWYFLHFAHLTTDIHRGYGDSAFDIGLYDQGVWLLSRFHAPYVTLMGRNLFGDHTQFSLLALVPLYWIHAGADTLLYVQALMMALGAVPVYMLVMRRMNNPAFATVLAVSFLLHPALAQTNLENYHPDSFLIPVMGFVLYAAIENKPRMLVVFSVLALLCKEDVVLILLPLLIWFGLRRNLRLGIVLALGSIATAAVMTYVVMRSLIGVPTLNTWRIPFGGVGGFIKESFRKPADVVKYLIKSDSPNGRPFYAWQMIAPTGLMFLIAPEVAVDRRPRADRERGEQLRLPAPNRVPLLDGDPARARDGHRVRDQPAAQVQVARGRGRDRRPVVAVVGVPVGAVPVLGAQRGSALEPDLPGRHGHRAGEEAGSAERGDLDVLLVRAAPDAPRAHLHVADAVPRGLLEHLQARGSVPAHRERRAVPDAAARPRRQRERVREHQGPVQVVAQSSNAVLYKRNAGAPRHLHRGSRGRGDTADYCRAVDVSPCGLRG